MTASAQAAPVISDDTSDVSAADLSVERKVSVSTMTAFGLWTGVWWGGVGLLGALFFLGVIDFPTSTKASLYGISIWLNGWMIPLFFRNAKTRPRLELLHECVVLWMVSYTMTNLLWEIPWVIFSPFVFENLHTLQDVVAHTDWMRESIFNMHWWVLASFSSVDLRTVNHDSTFYSLEIFSFFNVATCIYFFHLNKKRSPNRYLLPVIAGGEAVAATFIFTFSEVFAGFVNMTGGVADTLLALVWTQYQYFVFPLIFGYIGYRLLLADQPGAQVEAESR